MVQRGQSAYVVVSNRMIQEVVILQAGAEFCTVKFKSKHGAIRVRRSRLFPTAEAARASIKPSGPSRGP